MEYAGNGIGSGVALGRVKHMPDPIADPDDSPRAAEITAQEEKARAQSGLETVAAAIAEHAKRAEGSAAEVLEAQSMMAADPSLVSIVAERIDAGATAERAVFDAFARYQQTLTQLGGYMAERAADLVDVARRVVAELSGVAVPGVPQSDVPFVLLARDLAPADTASLDLSTVLALVTAEGGPTSHTAIVSREKAITAVVGASGVLDIAEDTLVVVDAGAGRVIADPDRDTLAAAERAMADRRERAQAPAQPGATADGTPVALLANLASTEGAEEARSLGAEGVGLLRTEFLFSDEQRAPSIREQHEQYARVFTAFAGCKVVVRALDAGADKPLAFLNGGAQEENPALGVRGLRSLRAAEQVLHDQLAALASAAEESGAEVWVMAPMVATVEETEYFVATAREHGLRTAGIMVEIPAAALLADRLMRAADFVSIGTNDLTQYTMAADRMLSTVAAYQSPWHPAVLRLIRAVGSAGTATGTPVGVCGEAAADPLLAVVLVGLGATSLSMAPAALADVRGELAAHTMADARALAEVALGCASAEEAAAAVRKAATAS